MASWKESVDNGPDDFGCVDVRELGRFGYLNVHPDAEGSFRIEGSLNGRVDARGIPESGVDRVLEEINVNPRTGWF